MIRYVLDHNINDPLFIHKKIRNQLLAGFDNYWTVEN